MDRGARDGARGRRRSGPRRSALRGRAPESPQLGASRAISLAPAEQKVVLHPGAPGDPFECGEARDRPDAPRQVPVRQRQELEGPRLEVVEIEGCRAGTSTLPPPLAGSPSATRSSCSCSGRGPVAMPAARAAYRAGRVCAREVPLDRSRQRPFQPGRCAVPAPRGRPRRSRARPRREAPGRADRQSRPRSRSRTTDGVSDIRERDSHRPAACCGEHRMGQDASAREERLAEAEADGSRGHVRVDEDGRELDQRIRGGDADRSPSDADRERGDCQSAAPGDRAGKRLSSDRFPGARSSSTSRASGRRRPRRGAG